jgi:hypothetical protein
MSTLFAVCTNATDAAPPEVAVPIGTLFIFNAFVMLGFLVVLLWKRLQAPLYFLILTLLIVGFSLRGSAMFVFIVHSHDLPGYVLNTFALIIPTLPLVLLLSKWVAATHESFEHSERTILILRWILFGFTALGIFIFSVLRIVFGVMCYGAGGFLETVGTVYFHPGHCLFFVVCLFVC